MKGLPYQEGEAHKSQFKNTLHRNILSILKASRFGTVCDFQGRFSSQSLVAWSATFEVGMFDLVTERGGQPSH